MMSGEDHVRRDEIDGLKASINDLARKLDAVVEKHDAPLVLVNAIKNPSDLDVLSLNIGGTPMDVLRGTLTCIPSMLAAKFSGDWEASLPKDSAGRYFIDEEADLFVALVNYLRDYNRMLPVEYGCPKVPSFNDEKKAERFVRMAETFNLTQHLWPFDLTRFSFHSLGFVKLQNSIYSHNSWYDDEDGACCYLLQRKGSDNRRVRTFEAQVYCGEKSVSYPITIGWLQYTFDEVDVGTIPQGSIIWLDLVASCVESFSSGRYELHRDIQFSNRVDPVVRCVNRGAEWFIDGKLVAETRRALKGIPGMQPFIRLGGKSSFRIIGMDLEYDEA
ncbi:hypothetical protein MPSEU_000008000 [Mayamaea pseudoterrestris]|nr:hypothetical protein MPSEU_000008000 [Mayamaea pseudoterrestris]